MLSHIRPAKPEGRNSLIVVPAFTPINTQTAVAVHEASGERGSLVPGAVNTEALECDCLADDDQAYTTSVQQRVLTFKHAMQQISTVWTSQMLAELATKQQA